jgi:hypothetical protein
LDPLPDVVYRSVQTDRIELVERCNRFHGAHRRIWVIIPGILRM